MVNNSEFEGSVSTELHVYVTTVPALTSAKPTALFVVSVILGRSAVRHEAAVLSLRESTVTQHGLNLKVFRSLKLF